MFAGLPTRPIFYLAVAVFGLVLAYRYGTTYRDCAAHAALREDLHAAIQAGDEGDPRARLHLSSITDFPWDRAEIIVNYKPPGATTDCPFGWDWSQAERDALVADDLLTVIVLLRDGKLVNYIEYRRDWAEFLQVHNPYTPETAVFQVQRSSTNPFAFILTPTSAK